MKTNYFISLPAGLKQKYTVKFNALDLFKFDHLILKPAPKLDKHHNYGVEVGWLIFDRKYVTTAVSL